MAKAAPAPVLDRRPASLQALLPIPLVVGFALLLSFIDLQRIASAVIPAASPSLFSSSIAAIAYERLLEVATFALIALASKRLHDLAGRLRGIPVWVCAGACCLLALTRIAAHLGWIGGPLADIAHGFALGVFPSVLWMCWIELYARLDMRHVLMYYLAAYAVYAVMTFILGAGLANATTALPCLALCAVLPLASAALMRTARASVAAAPFAQGEEISERRGFPFAPVAFMAVTSYANVFARDMLPGEDRLFATVGVLVCLVLFAVAANGRHAGFRSWGLSEVAFPLSLAGLLCLMLNSFTWSIAASALTHAGEALFTVFIGVVLCNISFRHGVNPLMLFGFTEAAGSLASLAGAVVAMNVDGMGTNAATAATAATIFVLSLCYVVFARRQDGEITWGLAEAPGAESARPLEQPDEHELLRTRCSHVAYQYGLTRREEEVLFLLAQDKPTAEIEEALCVSKATVKSHAHAVYQKTGLRNRGEVVAFLASGKADAAEQPEQR